MELQQARRDEVARLESIVEELQAKAAGLERVAAERETALTQARRVRGERRDTIERAEGYITQGLQEISSPHWSVLHERGMILRHETRA